MATLRPVLAGPVLKVDPFQEPIRPDCLVKVSPVQVIVPVEAHPQEGSGRFVVDVDRPCVRPVGDALQEDQAARTSQ